MANVFFVDKTSSASSAFHDDHDDHDDVLEYQSSKNKQTTKHSKRKQRDSSVDDDDLAALEEEKRLEALVFDDPEEILDIIAQDNNYEDVPKSFSNSILDRLESSKSKRKKETKQLQPVWVDDQDEELTVDLSKSKTKKLKRAEEETQIDVREYENRLRALKEKTVYQSLDWAQLSETTTNGADILQTNKSFISKSSALQPHQISFMKATDANAENPFKHAIKCVNFHPKSQLLLVASSEEKQFRLFNVDGAKNSQVQSVSMEKFPIRKALFSPNGKEVFAISPSQHCYIYDIQANSVRSIAVSTNNRSRLMDIDISPDNQFVAITTSGGQLDLFSDKSKRRVHSFQTSGRIVASVFSPNSNSLYCASDDRSVYIFDIKGQRCTHKFVDEGSNGNTCLGFSHDGSLLALGSNSGVVNVYETKSVEETANPVPVHTIMNLKTSISKVMFNSTSELLAIHSSESVNGIRLIHTPSWTTYQNWPEKSRIRYSCFDISPNSGYACLGTHFGSARLYRFLHFGSA